MQSEIKDISGCVKEITITVPKEEAQSDYASVIKDFSKYVVVPGFRKGKAPLSMVVNVFGSRIKEIYLNDKVSEYFEKAMKDKEIEPLFDPQVIDVKWEPNEELVAIFRYEITPEIEIEKYTGLNVEFSELELSEEIVNKFIDRYRKRNPIIDKDIQAVDKECYVIFTPNLSEDGMGEKDFAPELASVEMANHTLGEEFDKNVIGAKIEDIINTSVELETNKKLQVSLKVSKIIKIVYPDVDEEFAKNEGFSSLEDLYSFARKEVLDHIQSENENNKKTAMNLALIEANDFDLPPTSIVEFSKKTAQPYSDYYNKPVDELAKEYYGIATYEMKTYFIVNKLLEMLQIDEKEEDKNAVIEEMAQELKLSTEEFLKRNPDVTNQPEFVERLDKKRLYNYLFENNNWVAEKEKEEKEEKEQTESEVKD